jgi:hypothetical protein
MIPLRSCLCLLRVVAQGRPQQLHSRPGIGIEYPDSRKCPRDDKACVFAMDSGARRFLRTIEERGMNRIASVGCRAVADTSSTPTYYSSRPQPDYHSSRCHSSFLPYHATVFTTKTPIGRLLCSCNKRQDCRHRGRQGLISERKTCVERYTKFARR